MFDLQNAYNNNVFIYLYLQIQQFY